LAWLHGLANNIKPYIDALYTNYHRVIIKYWIYLLAISSVTSFSRSWSTPTVLTIIYVDRDNGTMENYEVPTTTFNALTASGSLNIMD